MTDIRKYPAYILTVVSHFCFTLILRGYLGNSSALYRQSALTHPT